jgi:hypothetical protein
VRSRAQDLRKKLASATKRISEKYTVMCHGNGLLLITMNEALANRCNSFGFTALASRDRVAKTPPPFSGENFLSGRDNGRDRLIRA